MSGYETTFIVLKVEDKQYELCNCRMDYRKRVVYTKDLSCDIKSGDKLFRENKGGYIESYLVIHVRKK